MAAKYDHNKSLLENLDGTPMWQRNNLFHIYEWCKVKADHTYEVENNMRHAVYGLQHMEYSPGINVTTLTSWKNGPWRVSVNNMGLLLLERWGYEL